VQPQSSNKSAITLHFSHDTNSALCRAVFLNLRSMD
jgi:hypothetical protein